LSMTCGPFAIISYIKDWKTLTLSHSHPPPPLSLRLSDLDLSHIPGSLRCGAAPSSARASRARGAAGQASTSPRPRAKPPSLICRLSCHADAPPHAGPPPLPAPARAPGIFACGLSSLPTPAKLSRRRASCARLPPLPARPGITLRAPDRRSLHRRGRRSSLQLDDESQLVGRWVTRWVPVTHTGGGCGHVGDFWTVMGGGAGGGCRNPGGCGFLPPLGFPPADISKEGLRMKVKEI
jgi:hypothetical protein